MQKGIDGSNRELFDHFKLGIMSMKNRFVVPSVNRHRGEMQTNLPHEFMSQFYGQRYHNALIITEGCLVSKNYCFWGGQPGLFNRSQMRGWSEIVDKVHSRASNIIAQLFHPGRVVSDSQLKKGQHALAPSGIRISGVNALVRHVKSQNIVFTDSSQVENEGINQNLNNVSESSGLNCENEEFSMPREMSKTEIRNVIEDFKEAGIRAKEAGFDGVQVEAGNGYLIESFLKSGSNKRNDEYGGSIENRCRLCLEIVDALILISGSSFVSVKISPISTSHEMSEQNYQALYSYLLGELDKRCLAFVEISKPGHLHDHPCTQDSKEIDISKELSDPEPDFFKIMRSFYKGSLIATSDFESIEFANSLIKQLGYQAIAFEALSITNPDIPQRVKEKGYINTYLRTIFLYKGGRHGYVDYPFYIAHAKL